ncbi:MULTISPECIES: succinate dehydrogenase cytochrome b558 subunit [Heyndrickxia]|uniref:Uncharacterized protein n=2 Tax=Heyndrickxia coagulans TaxID=1398 RepID=A0A150KJ13_HEYCO|nr:MULTISPECIES: succinate dehydrogenase cytochrome b558 subunit [Heyndrickxia]AJH78592.1 succinate dehydrogenase cytochrome b558 subunit [Heyndrickxia coagulans DSM 1 = ATCC 7050]KYC59422.1 hypothetical protein B4098_2664 [Heyndrickxia coagulans]KYC73832.1 hypothetical protein B4099_2793 [Heyndrickxia coagulans]MBF8417579.1 succinate dehydrogenase cytochrome b558 subunit [Heyndrickxia coagulans]MCR2846827.1 succinate dehydrogenase cytochrome b558 subunit [Heyndrickxia coagulans]
MAGNREFYNRKLHSLLGVVPIGLFLVIHLTVNHYAVNGAAAFNKAAGFMENLPFLLFVEVVFIYLPLLFHAIYGLYISFTASSNVGTMGYFRNWMYLLQRISGVLVLIFLVFHIYETRIQMALGKELNFDLMANLLANRWMLAWYIIGTVAAIFHFANGLWSFLVSWGITQSRRSQQISTYVMIVVFVLLSVVGVRALLAFA